MNISEVVKKEKCSGCLACVDVCGVKAISIHANSLGYYEPIIDASRCTECNRCIDICSSMSTKLIKNDIEKAFVFQNSNAIVRNISSSGGAFSAIAKYVIDKNGLVIGAAYDERWKVKHIIIKSCDELYKLNGSKYVQSDVTGIYKYVKACLMENPDKYICFSGTPCEINGLRNILGRDYSNLILVEVVCHGVGSPKLWQEYITNVENEKKSKITSISFRSKAYGYAASCMLIECNRKKYTRGKSIEAFKALYFKGYNIKPNCYQCNHKGNKRGADITLFDCWHMNIYDKKKNDNKGTTAILVNTASGNRVIHELMVNNYVIEVDKNRIISTDGDMLLDSPKRPADYDTYLNTYVSGESIKGLIDKYCPYDMQKKLRVSGKRILSRLNILCFFQK